jgi:predicted phosphodiesterase
MSVIGILSDIHGNLPALEQALTMGEHLGVASWVCLGDVIDGGKWNNECARFLRDRGIATVRGNHDEDDIEGIAPDVREYLNALPETLNVNRMHLSHISMRRRPRKIADRYEAWNVFDETDHPLMFVGHSHISAFWSERCNQVGESHETVMRVGKTYQLSIDDRFIVSVGSLGYSRDADPRPRFGTFDGDSRALSVHAVPVAAIK